MAVHRPLLYAILAAGLLWVLPLGGSAAELAGNPQLEVESATAGQLGVKVRTTSAGMPASTPHLPALSRTLRLAPPPASAPDISALLPSPIPAAEDAHPGLARAPPAPSS